jgi:hypothetical protein
MKRPFVLLVVAASTLVALFAIGVPFAGAAFSPPVYLSPAGQDASGPQVVTDAAGGAVALWRRFDGSNTGIQARTISAAGVLGQVKTLAAPDPLIIYPEIASDAHGGAIAVWAHFGGTNYRVQARRISAAGVLGPVMNLSAAGEDAGAAGAPQIASDADGNAIVVWGRGDGTNARLQARTISAAGALGPVKTIAAAGAGQVATDAAGDAVALWQHFDGTNYRIQARTISAAGALGQVKTLSAAGRDAYTPDIASDGDGGAVAVWQRSDGTNFRIQARTISAAGALGQLKTLDLAGRNSYMPQIASDADGDAVAVWYHAGPNYSSYHVQVRMISAAGALGPLKTISAASTPSFAPQIASDATGNAIAVWSLHAGYLNFRIQARAISAAGALGQVMNLSPASEYAAYPQIASDADGDAVAVWERSDGSNTRIQAALGQ